MSHILLVDDMELFQKLVGAMLKRFGHEVTTADNGREALDQIAEQRPDAVLLDLSMPIMDGLTCLKRLRDDTSTHDLPVVVMSAVSDPDIISRADALDIQGYLIKSAFSREQLNQTINSALTESV